jgi:putative intracellular protease/amidase
MRRIFQKAPIKRLWEIFVFSRNTFVFSSVHKLTSSKEQEFGHANGKEKSMNRMSFGVAILLSLFMIYATAGAQATPKVLLIVNEAKSQDIELMLVKEVGVMIDMLQKAGFKVVVANVSGKPIEGPVSKLKSDLKVSEVKIDDYVGFLLPCMAPAAIASRESPEVISIVKQAVAKGRPVAATHNSVYILAEAGILDGKRFAFPPGSWAATHFFNIYLRRSYRSGSGVVPDGNIITSGVCPEIEAQRGLPDGTSELTRVFIEKLKQKGGN